MNVQPWVQTLSRTVRYLAGLPTPITPPAPLRPVSWWAAARSAMLFVSLPTLLQGLWLASDNDAVVRAADLHLTLGLVAMNGVMIAVAFLAPPDRATPIRFAWPAFLTGAFGVYICNILGRSFIEPGWNWWTNSPSWAGSTWSPWP